MLRRSWGIVLVTLGLTLGLAFSAAAEEFKLGIIHTNDSHGNILPFSGGATPDAPKQPGWGGMARRRVAIERARADTAYAWLTLDAGDVFEGTPLSNLLTGYLDLECMNQMGYDAMCIGNHEFDFGYDLLMGRKHDVNFPMLCANVADKQHGGPIAAPYVVLQRGGYRIGIIGLTTETLYAEGIPALPKSVDVYPATPVCKALASYLRSTGCDVVIALTHQGYNRDCAMAAAVPELDAIMGGHTHTYLYEPTRIPAANPAGFVLVAQDWEWGQRLGIKKLTFARAATTDRFKLTEVVNADEALSPELPEDDGLKAFIGDYNARFEAEMQRVVCTAGMDFPADILRTQESALGDMVADAMRSVTGADAVLFNAGTYRQGLKTGPVTYADLYGMIPYDNILIKETLTGGELRALLDHAGTQYLKGGFPTVSGLRLHYKDSLLISADVGAAPLDDHKTYTVVVTDFLYAGGDGYPAHESVYGPGYTGINQRSSFAQWASQQGTLNYKTDGRLEVEWSGPPPTWQ